jgi:hypothetical protein
MKANLNSQNKPDQCTAGHLDKLLIPKPPETLIFLNFPEDNKEAILHLNNLRALLQKSQNMPKVKNTPLGSHQ